MRVLSIGLSLVSLAACASQPLPSADQQRYISASPLGPEIPELEIDFPLEQFGLEKSRDGTKFVNATGNIKNVSGGPQAVPSLTFVFRSKDEKIIFSQDVKPLSDMLPAGEVMLVNASIAGIPKNAKYVDIGWKAD